MGKHTQGSKSTGTDSPTTGGKDEVLDDGETASIVESGQGKPTKAP